MSWLFTSDSQSIGASASASVLPMNVVLIPFRIDRFDLLAVQVTSPAPQFKSISSLSLSLLYGPTLTSIHDYWKNNGFDYKDFVGEVMPLLFNMLSRFVIAFLPRSKHLLISWLRSPSVVILEPKKIVCHYFHVFPICHEVMGPDTMVLSFCLLRFKPAFSLSSFTLFKWIFNSSSLSALEWYHSNYCSSNK